MPAIFYFGLKGAIELGRVARRQIAPFELERLGDRHRHLQDRHLGPDCRLPELHRALREALRQHRKTGDIVIGAANPPERFARVLAKTITNDAPYSRHAAGIDAIMLLLMSKLMPGWLLHRVVCFAMRLPRPGTLRALPRTASANR
jgi:hypothetical protein